MNFTTSKGLTGNSLKYIAIVAMLIDHIAMLFVPSYSVLWQVMRIIGRITAPTMCYFIAEGYFHTRNVKKYALRLGIFALISHFPFIFMGYGKPFINEVSTSVIYTLFLGLLSLWAYKEIKSFTLKVIAIIAFCILAMPGDGSILGVLWVLAFGINHGNLKKQIKWFIIINGLLIGANVLPAITNIYILYNLIIQMGVFLAVPLIALYNGKRGKGRQFNKWLFYIFYPLHLIILGIIKYYII